MPNVNEIPTQVREAVRKGQGAVSTTARTWSETVGSRVPEINLPVVGRYVPQAKSAVRTGFGIAEQAVTRQRDFVISLLDTVEDRFGAETKQAQTASSSSSSGSPSGSSGSKSSQSSSGSKSSQSSTSSKSSKSSSSSGSSSTPSSKSSSSSSKSKRSDSDA